MPQKKSKEKKQEKSSNTAGGAKTKKQAKKRNPVPGLFSGLGTAAGGLFGPSGAAVGNMLGKGLANIVGFGDYTVSENTLATTQMTLSDAVPSFAVNEHATRIRHREYIGDVVVPVTPASFTNTMYRLNPGNATLFPWLATIAKQYQQYKFKGMVFEYKTMTSDYAANGPLGTVILATNYNANDRAYPSKIVMENSEFACSTKPSHSLIHPIESAPKERLSELLFVRDPTYDTTSGDNRLYDYGMFQIATAGLPGTASTTLGELWVSYDIELYKPIVSLSNSPSSATYAVMQPATAAAGGLSWNNWTLTSGQTGLVASQADALTTYSYVLSLLSPSGTNQRFSILRPGRYAFEIKFGTVTFTADNFTAWTFSATGDASQLVTITGQGSYANSAANGVYSYILDVPQGAFGGAGGNNAVTVTVPNCYGAASTNEIAKTWFKLIVLEYY